jgi:hypothetical protein
MGNGEANKKRVRLAESRALVHSKRPFNGTPQSVADPGFGKDPG